MNITKFKIKAFFQRLIDRLFGVKYPKLPHTIFRREALYQAYDELQTIGYGTQATDMIIEEHEERNQATDELIRG